MPAFIYGALQWAMGGLLQTMLLGSGMALVTYFGLEPLVQSGLDMAVNKLQNTGLPEVAFQLAMLAGVGEAVSILGAAILTRITISAATKSVGLKKAGA